jgi:hypothetical protein
MTRQSIHFKKKLFAKRMNPRVKPAGDAVVGAGTVSSQPERARNVLYIPGIGMISVISIHAPGISRWGWSWPKILVAASCDSACTIE